MGTDNLKTNYELIFNKDKKNTFHYFLIETNIDIPYPLYIADFITIYSLNQIRYNIKIENRFLQEFINKLKIYRDQKIDGKFYRLLGIKIVNLSQKTIQSPATKLSDIVDPEVGMSVHPNAILQDALNIFSIYFNGWLKQIASLTFYEESELDIIKVGEIISSDLKESRDLSHNINTICSLRLDQFYLLQKCFFRFHNAILISDLNTELSLALLLTSFDPAAIKYKSNRLENQTPSFLRKAFFLNYYPKEDFNELTDSFIENLNYFIERYLHYGIDFIIPNLKTVIKFNRFDQDNKLTTIPSYINIRGLIQKICTNFIRNLYNLKDDEEDKSRYSSYDLQQRGIIFTKINKPKKPGEIIYDTDTYRDIEYSDLQWFRNKSNYIEDLIKNGKNEEALTHIEEAQNFHLFNLNYYDCRKILYLKIFLLFQIKNYAQVLDIYNNELITIVPEENLQVFNIIAYTFAHKGDFEEAHRLINKIIDLTNSDYLKASFLDSKGEFYQFQKKYKQAIEFYKSSLEYFLIPPYIFHKETLERLKYCYNQIGSYSSEEIEEIENKLQTFEDYEIEMINIAEDDKILLFYEERDINYKYLIENAFSNIGIRLTNNKFPHYSEKGLNDLLSNLKNKTLILLVLITPNSSNNLWIQNLNKNLATELKYSNIHFIPIAFSNEKILSNFQYYEFFDVNYDLEQQISKFSMKIKKLSKVNLRNITQIQFANFIKRILERENFKIEEDIEHRFDYIAVEYYKDQNNLIKTRKWIIEIKKISRNLRIEDISKLVSLIKNSFQEFGLLLVTNTLLTTPLIEFLTNIKNETSIEIRILDLVELRRLLYNYDDLIDEISNSTR